MLEFRLSPRFCFKIPNLDLSNKGNPRSRKNLAGEHLKRITPSDICIVLHIIGKPISINFILLPLRRTFQIICLFLGSFKKQENIFSFRYSSQSSKCNWHQLRGIFAHSCNVFWRVIRVLLHHRTLKSAAISPVILAVSK